MFAHTLILATTRLPHPEQADITRIKNLLNQGLAMIEYFGPEIDNQADFEDEDMRAVGLSITYIEFFFETDLEIEYDALNEEQIDVILTGHINASYDIEINAGEKDITINLHH